jgi:hypothetical protein
MNRNFASMRDQQSAATTNRIGARFLDDDWRDESADRI